MTARIKGTDWSHWNGKPDCVKAKELGIEWAYTKAGEINPTTENEYWDTSYERNLQKLKENDIIAGAYYYVHPSVGASVQARHFERIMEVSGKPDFLVLDLEDSDGLQPQDVASVVKAILERLEKDLGKRPLIYTSNSFWTSKVGAPDWGKDYYFIIAQYPYVDSATKQELPVYDMDAFNYKMSPVNAKIADRVVAWQFSSYVKLAGMPRMDGNFWLKERELLHEIAGKTTWPVSTPTENQPHVTEEMQEMYGEARERWNKTHTEENSFWWKILRSWK